MAQVSPGVQIFERSVDNVVPSTTSNIGAFVGAFNWGPVGEITTIGGENDLVTLFQKPTEANYIDFLSAANFLSYSNALKMVRVVGAASKNAVSTGTAVLIKNQTDYTTNYAAGQSSAIGVFAAKYAGTLGNSLGFSIADSGSYTKTLTGTLDSTTSTVNLAGTGTQFSTELEVGSIVKNASGVVIGTIATITSPTAATFAAIPTVALTAATANATWKFASLFAAPGTSDYVNQRGGSFDEVHIVITDDGGLWSGVKGSVLKTFGFASKAIDAKNSDGTSNYYADVISRQSTHLWWVGHPASSNWGGTASTTFTKLVKPLSTTLTGGVDAAPVDADILAGWLLFANSEQIDISLAFTGSASVAVKQYVISNLAEVRKDVVAFVSPAFASVVNNIGLETAAVIVDRNALPSSSYAFMDSGWKYMYDRYNDKYRWIPLNADMAGLAASVPNYFDSFGGVNKGQIKNVERLAWNPDQNARDALYLVGVNPCVTMRGQGTYLYGDKTLLSRPSVFDRVGTRRLFIGLEKSIATAAKYMLFEFNDPFTRARFKNMTEPFLRTVQGLRGITGFKVICDDTNNTTDVVSRNEFVGALYIRPNYSINYITLNFVAVGANVTFAEAA
jgi:hypothetical protein